MHVADPTPFGRSRYNETTSPAAEGFDPSPRVFDILEPTFRMQQSRTTYEMLPAARFILMQVNLSLSLFPLTSPIGPSHIPHRPLERTTDNGSAMNTKTIKIMPTLEQDMAVVQMGVECLKVPNLISSCQSSPLSLAQLLPVQSPSSSTAPVIPLPLAELLPFPFL